MAWLKINKRNKQLLTSEETVKIEVKEDGQPPNGAFSSQIKSTNVDAKSVREIATVTSCLNLICNTIAQLPVYLYQEKTDGSVEKIKDDRRVYLLNNEVNEHLTSYDFKRQIIKDYFLEGHSFTYVQRNKNIIDALYLLPVENLEIKKFVNTTTGNYTSTVEYKIQHTDADKNFTIKYEPHQLLSLLRNTNDGIKGLSILKEGKKTFELALNENNFSISILNQGAMPLGILETDSKLTKTIAEKLRASWENIYGGAANIGKTVILEHGLKYKPLSLSPKDLGLQDSRRLSTEEICKLFNVPPSLLGVTGGNIVEDHLNFVKFCLSPIIIAIEQSLDKNLLLEVEKQDNLFFRFDTSELIRMTEKSKYEAIEIGMRSGAISINEARAKLDMPKLEHDYIMLSLGNIFMNKETGEITVPNKKEEAQNE